MDYFASFNASCATVHNIRTCKPRFSVPVQNPICVGTSSSGSILAAVTEEVTAEGDRFYVTAYDQSGSICCRLHMPFFVKSVAVNNSVTALALVVQTDELPYDVVLIYNTQMDEMTSVFHGYGAAVTRLRFVTNKSLMINVGVVLIDV